MTHRAQKWDLTALVVYGLTLIVAALMLVETINMLFYDPYGDEFFLFRLHGILAGADMSALTWVMFGSLFVALMAGLPLAFPALARTRY